VKSPESRLELVTGTDVDVMNPIGQATFFQHDVDFLAVGCGGGIDVDHCFSSWNFKRA